MEKKFNIVLDKINEIDKKVDELSIKSAVMKNDVKNIGRDIKEIHNISTSLKILQLEIYGDGKGKAGLYQKIQDLSIWRWLTIGGGIVLITLFEIFWNS